MNAARASSDSMTSGVALPASVCPAARWAGSEDAPRAKVASPIAVTGTARSRAVCTVHLPVPFCEAASTMRSTRGLPVCASTWRKTSTVISMR